MRRRSCGFSRSSVEQPPPPFYAATPYGVVDAEHHAQHRDLEHRDPHQRRAGDELRRDGSGIADAERRRRRYLVVVTITDAAANVIQVSSSVILDTIGPSAVVRRSR
jgi:hypothetical protein